MNNQEWYSQVIHFCNLSSSCSRCPYRLVNDIEIPSDANDRPCFSSKEALLKLGQWLAESHGEEQECNQVIDDDNQWLKDLLKVQFHDDDDDDELFSEEEYI